MEEQVKSMEEVTKEMEVSEIKKKMNDLLDLNDMEDLIKSNEKVFEINGITYRVRKPSYRQKQETYKQRVERFIELLKNDKYMLEKDLKQLYLKRGINIDEITQKIRYKMTVRDDLMFKLGEAIKNKAPLPELEAFKKEIDVLNSEIQDLSIQKTQLLEFSIEQQVMIYSYSYLTFLLAEKCIKGKDLGDGNKESDKWIRVWNTMDEFEDDKENIVNKFSYYVTLMASLEEM